MRNRGTIGGILSHADPAADWVSALSALGAEVDAAQRSAARARWRSRPSSSARWKSALAAGEIVEAVHVPAHAASARWGYVKSCRKTGEFAHAIGAVLIDPAAGIGARRDRRDRARRRSSSTDAAELFGGRIAGDFEQRFDVGVADALLAKAGIDDAARPPYPCQRAARAPSQEAAA